MQRLLRKLYWKTRNVVESRYLKMQGNYGLLPTRVDERDHVAEFGGFFAKPYIPKHKEVSNFKYQYTQHDNICTAAGAVLAVSEQTGIRWSIKAVMRQMVKDGQVSGNGFSHQRAPLDVMLKYGLVPYEDMPDENDSGWEDFKKYDKQTERVFQEVAPKYKIKEYSKLRNESAILEAIDNGYNPILASDWWTGMNRPVGPKFLLTFSGRYVGGHQFRGTGYREKGTDYETPQTFGKLYGDKGKAWSQTVIGKGYYENWIVDCGVGPLFPVELVLPIFIKQNEGKVLKAVGSSSCYLIENGTRRGVQNEETLEKLRLGLGEEMFDMQAKDYLLSALPKGKPYTL